MINDVCYPWQRVLPSVNWHSKYLWSVISCLSVIRVVKRYGKIKTRVVCCGGRWCVLYVLLLPQSCAYMSVFVTVRHVVMLHMKVTHCTWCSFHELVENSRSRCYLECMGPVASGRLRQYEMCWNWSIKERWRWGVIRSVAKEENKWNGRLD